MERKLISAQEAAKQLGVSRSTFYAWLAASDAGTFTVRGQPFSVAYYQGGAHGQGTIRIGVNEIERLLEAMRVRPRPRRQRRVLNHTVNFPGITVPLGRPDDS